MSAFSLALVLGVVIGAAYLSLAFGEFRRARSSYETDTVVEDDGSGYDEQRRGFSWIAGAGVVISTTLLVLASVSGAVWYLLPFLSIASAAAVVAAFVVDRDDAQREGAHR